MAQTDSGLKMVEMVINGFEKRLEHRKAHPTVRSEELFYESMISYNKKVVRTKKEGKLLGWVGLMSPIEVLYAMDIVPFAPELHSMLTASQGGVKECFDASAGYGLPGWLLINWSLLRILSSARRYVTQASRPSRYYPTTIMSPLIISIYLTQPPSGE